MPIKLGSRAEILGVLVDRIMSGKWWIFFSYTPGHGALFQKIEWENYPPDTPRGEGFEAMLLAGYPMTPAVYLCRKDLLPFEQLKRLIVEVVQQDAAIAEWDGTQDMLMLCAGAEERRAAEVLANEIHLLAAQRS